MDILTTLLEIVKYTIPAAVVYYLMRQFITGQQSIEQLKLRSAQKNETLPMRLQAYERLALFLERIKIPNLVMRLGTENSDATGLKNALLISVQKEFEHNLTQQIYVSDELWQIIELAKNSSQNYVGEAYANESSSQEAYADLLVKGNASHMEPIVVNAQHAIRKELEIYFK